MASALGPNPSQEEVEDEIILNRVKLETLDPGDMDYETEKRAIERDLESLYELQRNTQHAASPAAGRDTLTSRFTASPPPRLPRALSPVAQTPRAQRVAPVASFSSSSNRPASNFLQLPATARHSSMANKRPLDDEDDGSHYMKRATDGPSSHRSSKRPSPASSYPATPDSDDVLVQEADQVMGMLTAATGDPAARERAMARRREREREQLERARQAKRDEEFARSLSDSMSHARPPMGQTASQAVLNSNGTFRKQPPARQVPPPLSGVAPARRLPWDTHPAGSSRQPNGYVIKPEPFAIGGGGSARSASLEPMTPGSDESDIQLGTAEEFSAASAGRQPRYDMPGAFGHNGEPTYHMGQHAFPGPDISAQAYQGYSPYGPNSQHPVAGPSGLVRHKSDGFHQTMQAAGNWLKNSSSMDALRSLPDQLNDMLFGTANPFDPNAASQYNGLGYTASADRPNLTPYNPRDIIQIDEEGDYLWDRRYGVEYMSEAQQQEKIKELLDNIKDSDDSDPALREPTPEALREELYPHQRIGLAWMKRMEEGSNKGGILADDMGLGKTIQALSLMVSRPSQNPRRKTTLIVAPLALMRQWSTEIKLKLKPGRHQLSVYIHHGPKKKKMFRDLREFDVVLTTFGSLGVEVKKLEKWNEIKKRDPNALPTPRERLVLLADEAQWYRVIIDEAQCIKNRSTQSSKAASMLDAVHRWCMTGTPMMNGIEDLYAQLRFLHIGPFDEWQAFRMQFITGMTKSSNEDRRQTSMRKFQALLKAVLLRRTKASEIDGKPILQLPPRIVEVKHAIFSDDESDFYKGLEQKAQVTVNRYLREGTIMKHYSNILVLLLRLRQACCHPHLIKDYAHAVNIEGIPEEQRIEFAKQLAPAVIDRIIAANGEFECPVCYDATENPALMIPCGHDTCSECFTKITDPAAAIANGDDNGNQSAKCPQCREKADANKVIDYNTFKKVHQRDLWLREHPEEADDERASSDDDSDSDSDSDTVSEDGEANNSETDSLNGFIVDDDVDTEDDDDLDRKPRAKKEKATSPKVSKPEKSKKSKKAKGKRKQKQKQEVTLGELRKLAQRNKKSKQRYLRRLRREWITSAKIEKTLQIIRDTDKNDPTEKTIIFSQFTSLLDLLEVPIDDMGYTYERYDGSMNAGMRADAVHNFMTKPSCKIILVSLKAGNAGLNLTAASSVIILDPFWNPFVEEQAIDRAHRIGQRREVKVHRVLIRDTVEDRIIELQEKKREVIGMALDESASKDLSRLGIGQIKYLFGLGGSATARG